MITTTPESNDDVNIDNLLQDKGSILVGENTSPNESSQGVLDLSDIDKSTEQLASEFARSELIEDNEQAREVEGDCGSSEGCGDSSESGQIDKKNYSYLILISGLDSSESKKSVISSFVPIHFPTETLPVSASRIVMAATLKSPDSSDSVPILTVNNFLTIDEYDNLDYLNISVKKKCYQKKWKYFYELDKTEKVATLNQSSGESEWQKPTSYQEFNNSELGGEMYKIEVEYEDCDDLISTTPKSNDANIDNLLQGEGSKSNSYDSQAGNGGSLSENNADANINLTQDWEGSSFGESISSGENIAHSSAGDYLDSKKCKIKTGELVVSEKHKVYSSNLANQKSNPNDLRYLNSCLVLNTRIPDSSSFLNLFSFDQIETSSPLFLNASANATYGISLVCCPSNFSASDLESCQKESGLVLMNTSSTALGNSYSTSDISANSQIFSLCLSNSMNNLSGATNCNPYLTSEFTTNSLTPDSFLKKENNELASVMTNIYNMPSFLSCSYIPSLTSLPSLKQSSSVNLEFSNNLLSANNMSCLLALSSNSDLRASSNILAKASLENCGSLSSNSLDMSMHNCAILTDNIGNQDYLSFVVDDYSLQPITEVYSSFKEGEEVWFMNENGEPVRVKSIEKVPYSGKIYDVDVPNDVVLVRRRNGGVDSLMQDEGSGSYGEGSSYRERSSTTPESNANDNIDNLLQDSKSSSLRFEEQVDNGDSQTSEVSNSPRIIDTNINSGGGKSTTPESDDANTDNLLQDEGGKSDSYDSKIRESESNSLDKNSESPRITDTNTNNRGGVEDKNKKCYRKKWKYFADLDGSEKVMTLNNETGESEWQKPTAYQEYNNSELGGEMYEIETEDGELVVSPEHKIYADRNNKETDIYDFNIFTFLPLPSIISIENSETTNNLPLISCSENFSNTLSILDCKTDNFGGCMFNNNIPEVSCGRNMSIFRKSLSCVNITFCSLQAFKNNLELLRPFCAYEMLIPCLFMNFTNFDLMFSSDNISILDSELVYQSQFLIRKSLCSKTQSSFDVFFVKRGVVFQDFINCFSRLQHLKNLPNHNSCTFKSGCSSANLSICNNILIDLNSHCNENMSNGVYKFFYDENYNIDNLRLDWEGSSSGEDISDSSAEDYLDDNGGGVGKVTDLSNFELVKIKEVYNGIERNEFNAEDLVFLDGQGQEVKVKSIKKVPYQGQIYDVDVPNDIVLVRRRTETNIDNLLQDSKSSSSGESSSYREGSSSGESSSSGERSSTTPESNDGSIDNLLQDGGSKSDGYDNQASESSQVKDDNKGESNLGDFDKSTEQLASEFARSELIEDNEQAREVESVARVGSVVEKMMIT